MSFRILVVEDSATQAEALRSLLEEEGYGVVVARSAEAALERLGEETYDAVLSDVVMPGVTGYELCRQLKQDPRWREIPVVLLTSLADPMDIVRGLECGADNYITKPYDATHLLARVRHVLDNRRLRRNAKTSLGVTVRFLGRDLAITSEKEQILDLFISSVEDVVRANEALQKSQRALADAHAQLAAYAQAKAQEARVSTERYGALLQNAGDAILVLDLEGHILESNDRASDLLGRTHEEFQNLPLDDLLSPDDREGFRAQFERLGRERRVALGERSFTDATGAQVWCELTASVTRLDVEELVLMIARDVTARKRAEQALHATNERLEALIAAAPVAILVLDRDGLVQSWNQAAENIFGWTAEEAIGRRPPLVPPASVPEFHQLCQGVLGGTPLTGLEVTRVRKDGAPVEVSIYAAPLRGDGGETVGVMAVLADVTERKRAEEAQRERMEADRANRAKSEFLSRMSHELRTPLNAILGFGQLLEIEELRPDQSESVDQILRAGRHLLSLIDEVLDLSRIEAGKLTLTLEPVSVEGVVTEVVTMMRPLVAQQELSIVVDIGEARDRYVRADVQRLRQVLLNFASNAVKYNRRRGEVRFSVAASDGRIRIGVHDTGHGIAPHKLERLFVPFDRLGAEDGGVQGTGLGLVLSKRLAEAMNGAITVESTPGAGSTFSIELPASPAPVSAAAPAGGHGGDGAAGPPYGGRRTVLYIEDNLQNLRLVERVFGQRPEIRLLTAMEGSLGLQLALEHNPHLILLDLNLPDLDADAILDRLQAHPVLKETPVVVVTADAMPESGERFLRRGVRAYLTKPIDVKRFLSVVDQALAEEKR